MMLPSPGIHQNTTTSSSIGRFISSSGQSRRSFARHTGSLPRDPGVADRPRAGLSTVSAPTAGSSCRASQAAVLPRDLAVELARLVAAAFLPFLHDLLPLGDRPL